MDTDWIPIPYQVLESSKMSGDDTTYISMAQHNQRFECSKQLELQLALLKCSSHIKSHGHAIITQLHWPGWLDPTVTSANAG